MLDQFLKQLEEELELEEAFISEAPGVWTIPMDEKFKATLTKISPAGFSLACSLGTLPENNQEDFLDQVMLSNLFGQGTSGSILGIGEDEKTLILSYHSETDVDYQSFKDILEDFLSAADTWREEIEERKQPR